MRKYIGRMYVICVNVELAERKKIEMLLQFKYSLLSPLLVMFI